MREAGAQERRTCLGSCLTEQREMRVVRRRGQASRCFSFGLQGEAPWEVVEQFAWGRGGTVGAGVDHPAEDTDFPLLSLESSLFCEQLSAGRWVGLSRTFLQGHPCARLASARTHFWIFL